MKDLKPLVLAVLTLSAPAFADAGVVDAAQVYAATLPDGGNGFVPFPVPGQNTAVMRSLAALSASQAPLMVLSGADAGEVLGVVTATRSSFGPFDESVRVQVSSGTELWLHDSSDFWQLDGGSVTPFRIDDARGATFQHPVQAPDGTLRLVALDGNIHAFAEQVHRLVDGGFGAKVTSDLGPTNTGESLIPVPFSDTLYVFDGTTFRVGSFAASDAGFKALDGGLVSDPTVGDAFFVTQSYVYGVRFSSFTGSFEMVELTPAAVISRGTFQVRVDGGICGPSCNAFVVVPIPEAFGSYSQGALLVQLYDKNRMLLLRWEDIAAALGLQTDAAALPGALIGPDPGGGGGSGGGGAGGGAPPPLGPGIATSHSSGCASSDTGASALPILSVLGAVLWRARRRQPRR
ncbi:MAG TPA: hypothetical protein VFI53_18765 [Myxococcaceae bacterium]|nr:hypothetical protein [Myxococcaceae bacterium]